MADHEGFQNCVDMAVKVSGLDPLVCAELLNAGWTFRSFINEPAAWVSPEVSYSIEV